MAHKTQLKAKTKPTLVRGAKHQTEGERITTDHPAHAAGLAPAIEEGGPKIISAEARAHEERPAAQSEEDVTRLAKLLQMGLKESANPNVQVGLFEITPEWAERMLLQNNEGNRSIDRRKMMSYVRDMQDGKWNFTGEPIILDENNNILEGQHRLNACMISKVSFRAILITGIRRSEAFLSMGTGAPRRAADTLKIMGYLNSKVLQAAAKILWMYEHDTLGKKADYPSNAELISVIERNPGLTDWVKGEFLKKVPGPGSLMSVARYLFGKVDPKKAEEFFEGLASGAGLKAGSPVLQLREKLMTGMHQRHKMTQYEAGALLFKAYNAFLLDRDDVRLTFKNTKKGKEAFPKLLGLQEPLPGSPEEREAMRKKDAETEAAAPQDEAGPAIQ